MRFLAFLTTLCLFAACDSDEFGDDSVCGITVDGGDSVCGCGIDVTEENACENCPPIHAQIDEWTCENSCVGSGTPWEFMTDMTIWPDHVLYFSIDKPNLRLDVYRNDVDRGVSSTVSPAFEDHTLVYREGDVLDGSVVWDGDGADPNRWSYIASVIPQP